VIEGGGSALIPGLVNTHAHSHSSLTRGSAEGMTLEKWLVVIQREQEQLTDEQAYVGALATYAEALLSGTTTIVDMCIRPRPALAAARDIGIRAVIVPYVADTMPFAPSLECNARLLETADKGDRVRVWVGLHDLESCSDDLVREGAKLAREHGTGVHLHCSETRFSVEKQSRASAARRLSNCSNSAHSATAHSSPIASGSRSRTARCSPRHACMWRIARTRTSSSPRASRPCPTCASAA
jgi:5-methylthioadenosine/S-adenosylhomocysteine deaminase